MILQHGCHHAVQAAYARYGVLLDDADFASMVADIVMTLAGDLVAAVMLSRDWRGREIWCLHLPRGPAVRVVYSPDRVQIVTVLPPSWRLSRPA